MRICHVRLRHKLRNLRRNIGDLAHSVVYKIRLPAARQFPGDCLPHQFLIVLHHVCLDGHTVHRRLFQHTHIPDADEAHVQRPRNRRRGQCENIDVGLQLLDFLLVRHAKTLLLVDD